MLELFVLNLLGLKRHIVGFDVIYEHNIAICRLLKGKNTIIIVDSLGFLKKIVGFVDYLVLIMIFIVGISWICGSLRRIMWA